MMPIVSRFAFAFCLSVVAFNAVSQDVKRSPEQEKLSYVKGRWTIDGSETTYLEVCDWIEGNHLQCVSTSKEDGTTSRSLSYFSYSASEKVYIYYGLYSGGSTRMLKGQWVEDRFEFEGQRQTAEKLVKWRVTVTPNNGRLDFREERSTDNGEWKEAANFQYKPVK